MASSDRVEIAFVWSDIRRPVGGGEYFLLDVLRNIKLMNYKVLVKVYDVDQGLSLIKELNNYDAVIMNSLNKVLALIPFIKVPTLIDIHSADWLWYFRERELGFRLRPGIRLKRWVFGVLGRRVYCRVLNKFDYEVFSKYCKEAFLIPNFVDTEVFRPSAPKADEFTVVVRYDEGIKGGFHVFLKALKLLGKSRWLNAVIIGKEPPRPILNFINKFVNNVITLGRVPSRESLANVYSRAHTTIIPSLYESFSLTALESLACGTPIIMAKLPPTDWYVKEITTAEPGTGLTFRPGGSLNLAKKIRSMYEVWLRYKDIYDKLTIISREISRKFDIRMVLPIYFKIILNVME